jgi:hypothetical protein
MPWIKPRVSGRSAIVLPSPAGCRRADHTLGHQLVRVRITPGSRNCSRKSYIALARHASVTRGTRPASQLASWPGHSRLRAQHPAAKPRKNQVSKIKSWVGQTRSSRRDERAARARHLGLASTQNAAKSRPGGQNLSPGRKSGVGCHKGARVPQGRQRLASAVSRGPFPVPVTALQTRTNRSPENSQSNTPQWSRDSPRNS